MIIYFLVIGTVILSAALLFGQVLGIIPDPFPFWHSSQKIYPGLNLSGYSNKKVDSTGPVTSDVTVDPSYNNGVLDVDATATDVCSNVLETAGEPRVP